MPVVFTPLSTTVVEGYRSSLPDANGQVPERVVARGSGNPCRHCLQMIPEGAEMLVLAHRPFPAPQPYAEIGPIFLCADACAAAAAGPDLPAILASPDYIIRGYSADHRIVYGSGAVVPTAGIIEEAEARLANPQIAYLHVRSARNNCYQLRVDRA